MHTPADYLAPYPYNASAATALIWSAMEEAQQAAPQQIRALGVSNFDAQMLSELAKTQHIAPVLNQCRFSAGDFKQQAATIQYCDAHNITYQSYSPLHGAGIAKSAVLAKMAAAHGVSNQQIVLRWIAQKGIPLVTASASLKYDEADLGMFDFELTPAEMTALDNYSGK